MTRWRWFLAGVLSGMTGVIAVLVVDDVWLKNR